VSPFNRSALQYVSSHLLQCGSIAAVLASLIAIFQNPPAGLEGTRDLLADHGSFIFYWVILGVLSSIGLGSGLHTFVLFLGPHIVRIANAAVLHGNTGELLCQRILYMPCFRNWMRMSWFSIQSSGLKLTQSSGQTNRPLGTTVETGTCGGSWQCRET